MTNMADTTIASASQPSPPVAKRIAVITTLHGTTLTDHYNWLRTSNFDQPEEEILSYLRAENDYSQASMQRTAKLQENLYREFMSRPDEFLSRAPVREGRYEYFERRAEGQQYKTLLRRKRKPGAVEEVILDINELAAGKNFLELGETQISDSGNLLAYTTDLTGFRQYSLYVKNLRTGKTIGPLAERVTSTAWASDNRTLVFSTEDATTKRSNQVYRLRLDQKRAVLLFEEPDELFGVGVGRTRSGEYIVVATASYESTEYYTLKADRPTESLRVVLPREEKHRYYVDHYGRHFYIRTNEGAKNFRLVRTPVRKPGKRHWREVIAHKPDVLLEDIVFFQNHMVVFERQLGQASMRVIDMRSGEAHEVEQPEAVYSVGSPADGDSEVFADFNREFKTNELRFRYNSVSTPTTIFSYDLETRERKVVEQISVPDFDASQYHSELVYATAADGTKIPILLAWKGELKKDGQRPLYLYGYGAYGMCALWAGLFRMDRLSVFDRGVVFACAYIRGGGELGEPWHDGGKMLTKRNTFTDFIDCGNFLVEAGYGSRDRMVIEGRSAGGLLVTAVLNMAPNFCKAAVAGVPFTDVINTMLDETLPLTAGEFIEWGNPKNEEYFRYMLSYSPYDNIEAREYPALLVHTALHDSAVMYWEPAKYTAKLRSLKTDSNPLLFRILLEGGGHGGMSARSDYCKENAFRYAFILDQMGITE